MSKVACKVLVCGSLLESETQTAPTSLTNMMTVVKDLNVSEEKFLQLGGQDVLAKLDIAVKAVKELNMVVVATSLKLLE
jgi:hypothetical protein